MSFAALFAALLIPLATQGQQAQPTLANQQLLDLLRACKFGEAAANAEKNVAQAMARSGERHPDTIRAILQQGHLLLMTGQVQQAQQTMKRALVLAEAALPADSPILADTLEGLAFSLQTFAMDKESPDQQNPRDVSTLTQRALAIREKRIKNDPGAYLVLVEMMTSIPAIATTPEERLRRLARAMALAQNELGPGHLVTAVLFDALASEYGIQDKIDELQLAPGIKENIKRNVEQKRYPQQNQDILEQFLASGGLNGPIPLTTEFIQALLNLSGSYEHEGRFKDAERVYARMSERRLQQVSVNDMQAQGANWDAAIERLLNIYQQQGRLDDYDRLAEQASAQSDIQTAKPPATCSSNIRDTLAHAYDRRGDFDAAERYWKQHVAQLETQGAWSFAVIWLVGAGGGDERPGIAGFYERWQRWDKAEATFQRAIEISTRLNGGENVEVQRIKKQLAQFRERTTAALHTKSR